MTTMSEIIPRVSPECSLTDLFGRFDSESPEFYVANTARTGRNQFVGAFERLEGGDVGCRGQDPGKRRSDRIKGNSRMKTERASDGASERARGASA